MAKAPTVTVEEVSAPTNPRLIEWPHDEYGFTTVLRKEGVRAAGRIKGDPAKLDVFLATLHALAAHAGVKAADQRAEFAVTAREIAEREAVQTATYERDKAREVERLEAQLEAARAEVAAKVAE